MILCLVNNIFACANMLLGAAAVITAVYVWFYIWSEFHSLIKIALGCMLSPLHSYCPLELRSILLLVELKQREIFFAFVKISNQCTNCRGRRRFLTDYFHTAIILIIACYFSVKAFSTDQVGSIENLYDLIQAAAQKHPVSGNHEGTYLTMTSKSVSMQLIIRLASI